MKANICVQGRTGVSHIKPGTPGCHRWFMIYPTPESYCILTLPVLRTKICSVILGFDVFLAL